MHGAKKMWNVKYLSCHSIDLALCYVAVASLVERVKNVARFVFDGHDLFVKR